MGACRVLSRLLVLSLLLVMRTAPVSAEESAQEQKLKVAFVLNFAKFTSWPPQSFSDSQTPFLVCVGGEDSLGTALGVLADKQIAGRTIHVERLTGRSKNVEKCHLYFLGASEQDRLQQSLQTVGKKPILMVSDIPGFAAAGGTIELRTIGDRVGFVVNNRAAKGAGLHLSASLLQLAQEVL